jgi:hypothetical protein
MQSNQSIRNVDQAWLDLFEDRYGVGAFERLMTHLNTPCTSFAHIAGLLGVTRERVRQWHLTLLPRAPRGHQRRRLCVAQSQKRKLLEDPLFRTFYRHARSHFPPQQFSLIRARSGYKRRVVRLNGSLVVIKGSRRNATNRREGVQTYELTGCVQTTDFVYYQLTPDEFLFLPRDAVPPSGTTFIDTHQSKYWRYRNTFLAALPESSADRQAS